MKEMIEALTDAANMLERLYPGYIDGSGPYNEGIVERDKLIARIRALSVPAAAVVGEPVDDIAYNAGLEIRYAIAASGVDPIQHIPEVDAIIERRLAEARKAAFIEAAEMAEETAQGSDHLLKAAGQAKDIQGALVHGEGVMTARIIATALRRKAEETRT